MTYAQAIAAVDTARAAIATGDASTPPVEHSQNVWQDLHDKLVEAAARLEEEKDL